MTEFQFRYQSLVKFRRIARDNCRSALAEMYLVEQRLQSKLDALKSELDQCQNQTRSSMNGGTVDLANLARSRRYERVLQNDRKEIDQQMTQVQHQIRASRKAAVDAEKQVRILERLEAEQREHFELMQQRSETNRLDEAANQSYLRRDSA